MGRAKLSIEYRDNCRARRTTYLTRLKGLKKKAGELSLLCGVDVLVASFSSELNALEFWPENNTPEFCRIRERYLKERGHYEENGKITEQQIPCQPMPSPSFPLPTFLEEKAAIKIKLIEVRERIDFLQHQSTEEVELLQAPLAICMPSQQPQYLHPHQRPSPFFHSISPQLSVDFTIPLQQDLHHLQQPTPFAQSLPPHEQPKQDSLSLPPEQPSLFFQSFSPLLLADDLLTSLLPSDSPVRSNSDDLNWCDSLLLDYEFNQPC